MDKINKIADVQDGEVSIGKIDPREFGWDLTKFYEYRGSLTTPPCTEDVMWTIINKVIILANLNQMVIEFKNPESTKSRLKFGSLMQVGTVSRQQIDVLTDARRGVRTIHSHINIY